MGYIDEFRRRKEKGGKVDKLLNYNFKKKINR